MWEPANKLKKSNLRCGHGRRHCRPSSARTRSSSWWDQTTHVGTAHQGSLRWWRDGSANHPQAGPPGSDDSCCRQQQRRSRSGWIQSYKNHQLDQIIHENFLDEPKSQTKNELHMLHDSVRRICIKGKSTSVPSVINIKTGNPHNKVCTQTQCY